MLVVLADEELTAAKSFRNLARVHVLHVDDVGVADLVGAATLRALAGRARQAHRAREEARRPHGEEASA